jgi:hypothetical protein
MPDSDDGVMRRLAQTLTEAGVPADVQGPLLTLLAALHHGPYVPAGQMEILIRYAEQATCGMLSAPVAPGPLAGRAAASAVMSGISMQPGAATRADAATVQFIHALDRSPLPMRPAELSAHGRRLEATAQAILTASALVPPDELAKGLATVAQFPGTFLGRVAPTVYDMATRHEARPLVCHMAMLLSAVLEKVPADPGPRFAETLGHVGRQLPYAHFGLHCASSDTDAANLYPALAVALLDRIHILQPACRHAPLDALERSLRSTDQFGHLPGMHEMRDRLLQATDQLRGPVDRDFIARLRQQLRQLAEDSFHHRHEAGFVHLWAAMMQANLYSALFHGMNW